MNYHMVMASMKKETTFNEYWPVLKQEALNRGWSIGEFMAQCKIPRQRYSEFNAGKRITGLYMHKLMEGLRLTQQQIEQKSGHRFTPEQIRARQFDSFVAANPDIIWGMIDDSSLVPIYRQIMENKNK